MSWPRPLPDDLTREIFARAGYNNPLELFLVACSCREWMGALADDDFADRLSKHGVAPITIGFLQDALPTFVATTRSSFFPVDVPDRQYWSIVDFRHGRGLFVSKGDGDLKLLIWDPSTGFQRHVPVPSQARGCISPGAAFVCAEPGCNHQRGCRSEGEFKIAFVYSVQAEDEDEQEMRCFIFSSATGNWGFVASLFDFSEDFGRRPSVLAGNSLFFLSNGLVLFELNLDEQTFIDIDLPEMDGWSPENEDSLILMRTVDGGVGLVETTEGTLFTWSRKGQNWKMPLTFDHYFTTGTIGQYGHSLLGFAEGTRDFFVTSTQGHFCFELPLKMVNDLDGLHVKRVDMENNPGWLCPIVRLYTKYKLLPQDEDQQVPPIEAAAQAEV